MHSNETNEQSIRIIENIKKEEELTNNKLHNASTHTVSNKNTPYLLCPIEKEKEKKKNQSTKYTPLLFDIIGLNNLKCSNKSSKSIPKRRNTVSRCYHIDSKKENKKISNLRYKTLKKCDSNMLNGKFEEKFGLKRNPSKSLFTFI